MPNGKFLYKIVGAFCKRSGGTSKGHAEQLQARGGRGCVGSHCSSRRLLHPYSKRRDPSRRSAIHTNNQLNVW